MPVQKSATYTFQISTRVSYSHQESRPEAGYHLFVYKISISNQSARPAQLMARQWIITDGFGQTEEVRGAGVVGLQPKIQPGQTFEYESACPLMTTSGSMKGSYQFLAEDGSSFDVDIPEFYLIAPQSLH
ncbi:MAG: Co2+/Mg2+ efflux protein ApaG [Proteobacteria bacterium]|jgi:ApaG protein|nr:Co2+/Mg2+ efflux protein ApaG [Pseudomonadota bacterium]